VRFVCSSFRRICRKVDISAIRFNAFCRLANVCLAKRQFSSTENKSLTNWDKLTSLYEIERPGKWVERTVDTFSGTGGKDAADTVSSKEDRIPSDFKANPMIPLGDRDLTARVMLWMKIRDTKGKLKSSVE